MSKNKKCPICKNKIMGVPALSRNDKKTEICSRCGFQHKVYNNKVFICPRCGYREDRDLNAAYNLKKLAQDTVDGKEIVYSIDA